MLERNSNSSNIKNCVHNDQLVYFRIKKRLSKKLVADQLIEYIKKKIILMKEQTDFRKIHSCKTVLVYI